MRQHQQTQQREAEVLIRLAARQVLIAGQAHERIDQHDPAEEAARHDVADEQHGDGKFDPGRASAVEHAAGQHEAEGAKRQHHVVLRDLRREHEHHDADQRPVPEGPRGLGAARPARQRQQHPQAADRDRHDASTRAVCSKPGSTHT